MSRRFFFLLPILLLLSCTPDESGKSQLIAEPLPVPTFKRMSQEQYGVKVGSHEVIQDSFPEDQLLVDLLQSHGVSTNIIDSIDAKSGQVFDTRNMKAGNPYTILKSAESGAVDFFMYEEDAENFVVIDLREGVEITRGNQPVKTEIRAAYLPITTSLYDIARENQVDVAIVKSIEEIFAREIDFRKVDIGDRCQVLFEERYVDGRFIGVGRVLAALFQQGEQEFSAFLFEDQDTTALYYDRSGTAVNQPYLPYLSEDTSQVLSSFWKPRMKAYDIDLTPKAPVFALSTGVISSINGDKLEFNHREIIRISYQGLQSIPDSLKKGSKLAIGDTIGYAPMTNNGRILVYYSQSGKQMEIPLSSYAQSDQVPYQVENEGEFQQRLKSYLKAIGIASPEVS